jgi:hypothetical protein
VRKKGEEKSTEMLFEHGKSMGGCNEMNTESIQQRHLLLKSKRLIASGFNPRLLSKYTQFFLATFLLFICKKDEFKYKKPIIFELNRKKSTIFAITFKKTRLCPLKDK